MFKKRGRPQAARARDDGDEGEGESGSVPVGVKDKDLRVASATSGEGGLIGASSRKSDCEAAAVAERDRNDTRLSGLKANDAVTQKPADSATRRLDVDTAIEQDSRTINERNQEIHKGLKDGSLKSGVYRGSGGYKQYMERSDSAIASSKYTGLLGPTRNTLSNVRSTLRIEFWGTTGDGGLCKDYKETGYCGFGDSCKFAHDRSDYKPGYVLEREWEAKQKAIEEKKRKRWERRSAKAKSEGMDDASAAKAADADVAQGMASDGSSDESSDAELPSACPVCNQMWEDCSSIPTVTSCGHYSCEECALEHFAKSKNCIACGVPTNGIFNSVDALEERVKRRKVAKAEAKRLKTEGLTEQASSRPSSSGLYAVNS